MNDFISRAAMLGQELDAAFAQANYAEAAFSALATEHVTRARLHECFDLHDLARWMLSSRQLPVQHDIRAEFGDPPITLWNGRRFQVSALVWRSSTTAVHQHAFTGAFQVLQGGSVHSRYTFEPSREYSEDVVIGALHCQSIERLTRGMVRSITGSNTGIHALFHLEHPSVSLVVRTHADRRFPIQYTYYWPGLAMWDMRREPEQQRAVQVARMLLEVEPERGEKLLLELLPTLPVFDLFALLDEARDAAGLALALRLLAATRPHLDDVLVDTLARALSERDRQLFIKRRREAVTDASLRFLLAIVLNARSREQALALVQEHSPERPAVDSVIAWLVDLSTVIAPASDENRLSGAGGFGLPAADAASLVALHAALNGQSVSAAANLPFYEAVTGSPAFAPLFCL